VQGREKGLGRKRGRKEKGALEIGYTRKPLKRSAQGKCVKKKKKKKKGSRGNDVYPTQANLEGPKNCSLT